MKETKKNQLFFDNFFQLTNSPTLRRLIGMLILTGIIPSLIIFTAMYSISSVVIQGKIQEHSKNTLLDTSKYISEIVSQVEDISLSISINSNVNTLLSSSNLSIGCINRSSLRNIIENTLKMNRSLLNMSYIETASDIIYAYILTEDISPYDIRIIDSEYEQPVLQKNGSVYWFGVEDHTIPETAPQRHTNCIRCASAIYDANGTQCIGILSMLVRTSAFTSCLQKEETNSQQFLLLLDHENQLIASNKEVTSELNEALLSLDLSKTNTTISLLGTPYLINTLPSIRTGWSIVNLIPKSDVTQGIQASKKLLLPLLLIPFASILLVYFFVKRLSRDLTPMLQTISQIKKGNLSVRVPSVQDTAIDIFGQTLNEALDNYHQVMLVSGQQKELLTVARLKILRGQLSPHFLYNTLDSINWMLLENGQIEISRIISDLGYILRYSIDESSDTVPLQKEIEVIQRYLTICQNRFESRLNYSICVSPPLVTYEIPRFLLQPIVENAIIHGIEKTTDDSILAIRCYATSQEVFIDITNSGPSMTPCQKAEILNSFSMSNAGNKHIGLKNVYERIQLFYGPEYGLTLLDMEPHGTIVRLRLPLPRDNKEVTSDKRLCD